MKKNALIMSILATALCVGGLASCSSSNEEQEAFSFSIALKSRKKLIYEGDTDKLEVIPNGAEPDVERNYEYKTSDPSVATISQTGNITALSAGVVTFTVTETVSNIRDKRKVEVVPNAELADGGYNYAAISSAQDVAERTKILGALEKYAMETHLTGITLFENGGYVKYHSRVQLPTTNYITGYGFGVLAEGSLTGPLEGAAAGHEMYYHSASAEDPRTINAFKNTGSQVSDLSSYIAQSYWSTKMNDDKNGYEWYPLLAKDTLKDGVTKNSRPVPNEEPNDLGLYKKWKIYVKTSELAYRTSSATRASFNNRVVTLDDYEFVYRLLLTGSSNLIRGAEMAGDKTYGIKGAQQFFDNTKNADADTAKAQWAAMKADGRLGISTGTDDVGGEYIALELVNPIDSFTAMYTLSSSLVSPLPEAFFEAIGGGSYTAGAQKYGNPNDGSILDYTLCLGAFYLEAWDRDQQIVFKRNNDWFEVGERYHIEGVVDRIYTGASEREDYLWDMFEQKQIDAVGVPTKHLKEQKATSLKTKGDSTFKLNINSCTQERWNELNEKIWHNATPYECKPWMSNEDFLDGLFYSIKRKEFAEKRGVNPSINYFADSYLSDPENGVSYNSTQAHKDAVANYQTGTEDADDYGYSHDLAVSCFKSAVSQLVKTGKIVKGRKSNPTIIKIKITWMYQSDPEEYGQDIKSYFEEAFNDEAVCGGTVKLEVENAAVTQWEQVYSQHLQKGNFDLGFGAISGNSYNPLNFLEVLKSDDSSGFTLNWGPDTSAIDDAHPLIYGDGETKADLRKWSFDSLWEVADHGGVVKNGVVAKPVQTRYIDVPNLVNLDGTHTDDLHEGAVVTIPFDFVDVDDTVAFDVDSVQAYVVGSGNFNLDFVWDKENKKLVVTIPAAKASEINEEIRRVNKMTDPDKPNYDEKPFVISNYNTYWTFEVYFSLRIRGGSPSQSYVTVAKNADSQDN